VARQASDVMRSASGARLQLLAEPPEPQQPSSKTTEARRSIRSNTVANKRPADRKRIDMSQEHEWPVLVRSFRHYPGTVEARCSRSRPMVDDVARVLGAPSISGDGARTGLFLVVCSPAVASVSSALVTGSAEFPTLGVFVHSRRICRGKPC
jgi:hypothetical protein